MPITKRHWLAAGWAATILAAGWAGVQLGREPRHAAASPVPIHVTKVREPIAAATTESPGAPEIRAIVREELARQLADLRHTPDESGGTAEPASEPRPVTPELQVRSAGAAMVIDRAIQVGRWTSDDRKRFADNTRGLPPLSILDLQRALNVAINRGEVMIEDRLPPFGVQVQAH
jgi:hypothetical protein